MKKRCAFAVVAGFPLYTFLIVTFCFPAGAGAIERDSKWDSVYSKGSRLYLTHCAACRGKTHVASGA